MYRVIKRDGKIKDFDITKIVDAIRSAFISKQKDFNESTIELLALRVTAHYQDMGYHLRQYSDADRRDRCLSVAQGAGEDQVGGNAAYACRKHDNSTIRAYVRIRY